MSDSIPCGSLIPTESPTRGPGMELQILRFDQAGVVAPFRASRFVVRPGHATAEDHHAVAEVWVIASGRGIVHLGGVSLEVEAGNAVYIAPNTSHRAENNSPDPLVICSQWWQP